jgi:hypothetical protein
MLGCTDCVKRVFGDVVFHPDVSYVYPCDRPECLGAGIVYA